MTNFHVVNAGTSFEVVVGRDRRSARLTAAAPCDDLAVLDMSDTRGLRALPLGSQKDLEQGDTVVAMGFPASAALGREDTATAGVVSVVNSSQRLPVPDSPPFRNLIQTDATLNPGNSGGPLVDANKRLVGVNTAILTELGGDPIQSQGYAIGVDRVRQVIGDLRAGRSIGWFGTGLVVPPEELARRGARGLALLGAVPGSDSAARGLEGMIMTAINGRRLGTTLKSYCQG